MDSDFAASGFIFATLSVRRPLEASRSGGSETLSAVVELPAYREERTRYVPGATQVTRVTEDVYVVDAAEVSSSLLEELRASDRFWPHGKDPSEAKFGVKAKGLEKLHDPETGALSHWEVTL